MSLEHRYGVCCIRRDDLQNKIALELSGAQRQGRREAPQRGLGVGGGPCASGSDADRDGTGPAWLTTETAFTGGDITVANQARDERLTYCFDARDGYTIHWLAFTCDSALQADYIKA